MTERVIEEIEYRLFSKPSQVAALVFYLIASILMYLVYLDPINKPDPSIGGLSTAFAYSILVWVLLMASVFYAALVAWAD
ncbi:MAG: hypothetical protein F7C38_02915 [Desulfurococcales archaeon]|nr:hypothetical protein [Desulfurococcales archaeon]